MAKKFYDQDDEMPAEITSEFFRDVDSSRDKRLTMADAVAIIGVMAILFLPFTIAIGIVIAR